MKTHSPNRVEWDNMLQLRAVESLVFRLANGTEARVSVAVLVLVLALAPCPQADPKLPGKSIVELSVAHERIQAVKHCLA